MKQSIFLAAALAIAAVASGQEVDSFNLNRTYSVDEGGTIQLESNDANVEISGTDRTDVHLIVHYRAEVEGVSLGENRGFDMRVRERRGNLVIRERRRYNGSYTISNREYSIIIEVPKGVSLDIDGDDDEYLVSDIAGSIRMNLDDADADFRNCTGREFTFSYDDGTLTADRLEGTLDVNMDDGKLEIGTGDFNEITMESDDGEMILSTPLYDDGEYSFDMDDGSIDLSILGGGGTFQISHDNVSISYPGTFRSFEQDDNSSRFVIGDGNAVVNISTDDGSLTLRTK